MERRTVVELKDRYCEECPLSSHGSKVWTCNILGVVIGDSTGPKLVHGQQPSSCPLLEGPVVIYGPHEWLPL
jgi:hypothetical protein